MYHFNINTLEDLDECNPEMNRNFDAALYRLIAHENEVKFNCSVPFHPPILSNITDGLVQICNASESGKMAQDNLHPLINGRKHGSQSPCARMEIFLGSPSNSNSYGSSGSNKSKNEAFIGVYMQSDLKVQSMILYYDITSLAADIGGFIGMFLGLSIIDLSTMVTSSLLKAMNGINWKLQ